MESPVYTKDGFLFFSPISKSKEFNVDRLIIEKEKLAKTVCYIKEKRIHSVTINPSYSKVEDLDFLTDLHTVRGLYLLQDGLNLDPIHSLDKLEILKISDPNPALDLASLIRLKELGITYGKKLYNLQLCTQLKWLWLDNYFESDLQMISKLKDLAYLTLYKAKISTLSGISFLAKLEEIHIDTAKNLISTEGITNDNLALNFVDIFRAPNLTNVESLGYLKNLSRLRLAKTGNLENLDFVSKLGNLRSLSLGLKVLNGDMTPLKKIDNVSFVDFPHYNLKAKDFKKKDSPF